MTTDSDLTLRVGSFEGPFDLLLHLCRTNEIDLAALSPYAYVQAKAVQPNLALIAKPVTVSGSSYQGVIVVRAGEGLERLEDLRGRRFCFVQPGSTSGYLYPRALVRQAGLDPDHALVPVFGQDHLTTLRLLYRRTCDAAAVYARILTQSEAHGINAAREAWRHPL